jgi:hypothetical protein
VLNAQAAELEADPALRWYGVAVALINGLTAIFWLTVHRLDQILRPEIPEVCWPFFENCRPWRINNPGAARLVLFVLGALSIVNAALFIRRRVRPALALLVLLFAVKTALLLQDYRLVANQHYMAAWITMTFLFVPGKRATLSALVVMFYFWAGTLKLNADWLSGATLLGSRPFGMSAALIPAACGYVVVLELLFSWGLLSRRRLVFWAAFLQLMVFHVSSFWVVGYFYPILMFLILSLFPLLRVWRPPAPPVAPSRQRLAIAAIVAVFSALQLVPRLIPGDEAVNGEGRLLALNMFDAPVTCTASITPSRGSQHLPAQRLRVRFLQPRIACDPIVFLSEGRRLCRSDRYTEGWDDFDLNLFSQRPQMASPQVVIAVHDFCESHTTYAPLWHNSWIDPD